MTTPNLREVLAALQQSDRVRMQPPAGQPDWPPGVVPPRDVTQFYDFCGGVEFLDTEDPDFVRYRILPPAEVTDIGTATCLEAATEPPLSEWFVISADDNSEHAAIDVAPARSGQCYDVFHETFADPESAQIVAESFSVFLHKLFVRGRAYWFDEDFDGEYFPGDSLAEE